MANILLVEDNADLVFGLRNNLEIEGYEVDAIANGREAVERATAGYDLIILDLMIPGLNGFQVLSILRAKGCTTPILVLSARDADEDVVLGLKLGANDYVTKPFSLAQLLARVQIQLREHTVVGTSVNHARAQSDASGAIALGETDTVPDNFSTTAALSRREAEVVSLLQDGLTNKAIAQTLGVSVGTVKTHVHNVLQKLHIHRRTQVRTPDPAGTESRG